MSNRLKPGDPCYYLHSIGERGVQDWKGGTFHKFVATDDSVVAIVEEDHTGSFRAVQLLHFRILSW